MVLLRSPFWMMAALAITLLTASTSPAKEFMFKAKVDGKTLEGQPLVWSDTQMLLLGRDGAIHQFNPKKARGGKKTAPRFVGYEMPVVKRALYKEFSDRFDLTTTQRYIVVHPRGQGDLWAQRFEDLYRSFTHYMRVRGFKPKEPKFPLVAVVFRNKAEYYQHAAASGNPLQPGYLGHYSFWSNRVFLFDITGGAQGGDWQTNADTIIHEATHQTAYNVGIHTRFSGTPQWVVEGLATMFEAPGVWDSQANSSKSDRLNRDRLRGFQERVTPRWQANSLKSFVATDTMFKANVDGAYATAWALSFYLCETRPREYSKYLARTADRSMFTEYSAAERVADFESIFGNEWRMLEVKFFRYMADL